MLLHQKTLLQDLTTAVSCILFFVLRGERPTNQLKANTVVVKFGVILSLTLSMSFKKTTGGKKTTLSTHLATAKLFHNTKNTGTCRSQQGIPAKQVCFLQNLATLFFH